MSEEVEAMQDPALADLRMTRETTAKDGLSDSEARKLIRPILKQLEPHTVYRVSVKFSRTNVEHVVYLMNGFDTGGYTSLFDYGYGRVYEYEDIIYLYSFRVIYKLGKVDAKA